MWLVNVAAYPLQARRFSRLDAPPLELSKASLFCWQTVANTKFACSISWNVLELSSAMEPSSEPRFPKGSNNLSMWALNTRCPFQLHLMNHNSHRRPSQEMQDFMHFLNYATISCGLPTALFMQIVLFEQHPFCPKFKIQIGCLTRSCSNNKMFPWMKDKQSACVPQLLRVCH